MKPPWVKFYAGHFLNGVTELDAIERGVYITVLALIYDANGPVADDIERLARHCRMRPTSCEKVLGTLAGLGKITRADGKLTNARAEEELKSRQKVSEKSTESSHTRWEKEGAKPKQINTSSMPTHTERNAKAMPEEEEEETEKTLREEESLRVRTRAQKASRMTETWAPSTEDRAFARGIHFSEAEVDRIGARFRDYWLGISGKNGVKASWPATWRNWVTRERERAPIQRETKPGAIY